MKKIIFLLIVSLLCISLSASREEDKLYELASAIAAEMSGEPFVVRVAYGEMLINSRAQNMGQKKPSESDLRAAAAAICGYGFSGGALNVTKWEKAQNTPLEMRSGVRLYDWFFYI